MSIPKNNTGVYYGEDTVVWYDASGEQHVEYIDEQENTGNKRKTVTRDKSCRRQSLRGLHKLWFRPRR